MSRRHVLEDSDSEESHDNNDNNGGGHSSTKDAVIARFFTADEIEAIQRCSIQMYTANGIYSEECMSQIIERLLNDAPIELIVSAATGGSPSSSSRPSYQKYRPKSGAEKIFFLRDVYNLHDPKTCSSVPSDTSYFEEEILFEIELLRRSEKAVKNRMFKNKEKGVMVVFGPWWNYAFQRLLEVCLSNCSAESFGEFTAVKVIRSLFHFITDDLKDIVKPGSLTKAKAQFGLDWLHNIATARKVVNQCGVRAHFLDKELSIVEAHVESLKEKKKPVSLLDATTPSVTPQRVQEVAAAGTAGTLSKPDQDDAQNNARKARLAAMRKDAVRTVVPPPMHTAAPPPTRTVAPPPAQETLHGAQSIDRNTTSGGPVHVGVDHDGGWGRKRDGSSVINSSCGARADARTFSPNGPPQTGTSNRNEFDRNSSATGQGVSTSNVSASNNSGWGRNRDDAQSIKSKCAWSSARQMLNHDVALPESDAPDHDQLRQQNNHAPSRGGGREGEYVGTGGDRYTSTSSGSDYNSSQYRDSKISGRYEDRSYDRGGSRNGDREDYRYDDSRGRHDDYRDDKYRQSRSQEGNTNYRNDYNAQGLKRGWSSDHNDGESRTQKAARGTFETSAQPVATGHASAAIPSGIGRGRGAHVNKPAWMVRQEQSSVNDCPVGIQGNGGPSGEISSSGAPPQAESHSHLNYNPMWPHQNNAPTGISSNNNSTFPGAQPNQNYANTSGDPAASAYPPSMNSARAVSDDVLGLGRGRGRGRGASRNLPAWMTNQSNQM